MLGLDPEPVALSTEPQARELRLGTHITESCCKTVFKSQIGHICALKALAR